LQLNALVAGNPQLHKPKYIIGVDAALRNVGLGVRDNLGELVYSGNITTRQGMSDHDSVDLICEKFFKVLDKYLYSSRVYIEAINFGRQGKSTARSEAAGVLKWNLRQADIPIFGVEPKAWQSWFAKRYGFRYTNWKSATLKSETKLMVHRHLNLYTENDNIADAVAITDFGYVHTFENTRLSVAALCRLI